jgi:molybdenum cofactor cytidylyltransferase
MPGDRVAAVVLAAGLSSRMGKNKMLIEVGGRTLVRRAVETAISAGLDPILVVVGHESDRIRAELRGLSCTPVLNEEYLRGMNTSLRAGIRALPEDTGAAVVLLGDMPLVDARMVRSLVESLRATPERPLVISTYDGVVAPPILYARAVFPELRALDANACGKQVVKRHRTEAIELAWPPEVLSDLDEPADLERVRARLEAA